MISSANRLYSQGLFFAVFLFAFAGYSSTAETNAQNEVSGLGAATERAFAPIDLRG
jgi:hypothetical protein